MTLYRMPKDCDFDLASQTDKAMDLYEYEYGHATDYPGVTPGPITVFVTRAGIPVDEMINWCKCGNLNGGRDYQIKALEILKASMNTSKMH